jgi:hypothetical protein
MKQEMLENNVFDLLESKDFHELHADEKTMVFKLLSEEEYALQRRIILEAQHDTGAVIPGPLVLPSEKRVLPIWIASAVSAAAAAVIVFLLMPPSDFLEIELKSYTPTAIQDTLIVENTVTDTVIDYRYVTIIKNDCGPEQTKDDLAQIPDYATGGASIPRMRQNDFTNEGVSAANDAVLETFRVKPFIGM